ncbi:MAG: DNA-binding protein [Thermoprotei archaeon]|nr:MAG: DNA-binding protein [Thermoprotei archaeon]
MSYEYVSLLLSRSLAFMRHAREAAERGECDVACFMAEQAAQLGLKALALRLLGYVPRTHRIRELLGVVAEALEGIGERDLAEAVRSLATSRRLSLRLLEDAYTGGRYLMRLYDALDAEECVRAAEEVLEVVRRVEERLSQGGLHQAQG